MPVAKNCQIFQLTQCKNRKLEAKHSEYVWETTRNIAIAELETWKHQFGYFKDLARNKTTLLSSFQWKLRRLDFKGRREWKNYVNPLIKVAERLGTKKLCESMDSGASKAWTEKKLRETVESGAVFQRLGTKNKKITWNRRIGCRSSKAWNKKITWNRRIRCRSSKAWNKKITWNRRIWCRSSKAWNVNITWNCPLGKQSSKTWKEKIKWNLDYFPGKWKFREFNQVGDSPKSEIGLILTPQKVPKNLTIFGYRQSK